MNLGQVYTKRIVADYMIGLFSLQGKARVLDPCFGHGVFINSVLENTEFLIDGVEIDEKSFSLFENPNTERCSLKNCDFFDIEDRYDGIIMNPPYVRQEELNALQPLGVSKQKLQTSCGQTPISSKANLYMYFILRSILLLRDGGELIAIFPNSWMNTPVGKQFYEQICHHGCITDFINVEGEAFEGSPMVDVCIMIFMKGLPSYERTKYSKMKIGANDSLSIEPDEYMRIADKICNDLDNNLHYVALRLKEIQQEYHLTMDEVEDLAWWEDSTQVFEEIYWSDSNEMYGQLLRDDEVAPYTSPREYERIYNSIFYDRITP